MKYRIIPVLGLHHGGVHKTRQFVQPVYVGDPVNAVRIFNEKKVSELVICGFRNSLLKTEPDFKLLREIASEAFMPLAYVGGVSSMHHIERLTGMGFEKVGFNTAAFQQPDLVREAVAHLGASSVIGCIDVKNNIGENRWTSCILSGTQELGMDLEEAIDYLQALGVGEIMINHIDRDGCLNGFDKVLVEKARECVRLPLIFLGGASSTEDLMWAGDFGVEGVAASARFVFYGKHHAVLINYPSLLAQS